AERPVTQPLPILQTPQETAPEQDRPVAGQPIVLIVEHDRARLQQLDLNLSARGYTVVSMTRALAQVSRLARALRPRAVLLDLHSEGVGDVVRDLRQTQDLDQIPLLVFSRGAVPAGSEATETLAQAEDSDLIAFLEKSARSATRS
ncbi:MAG TPA: hypothetical protein VIU61_13450, partial [Kofleriaceae bacterium]